MLETSARFSSLTHGKRFQNKQRNLKRTEGFAPSSHERNQNPFQQVSTTGRNAQQHTSNIYTNATNNVLQQTRNVLDSSQSDLASLKNEYNNTLNEYNTLLQSTQNQQSSYVTRVNPNNPYLNSIVRFNTGHLAYVTNQGIVKYIGTPEILQSIQRNGCGTENAIQDLSIPWLPYYTNPGVDIPTTPPLVTGSFMKLNQSCGNEGKSVFVRDMLLPKDTNTEYKGCYNNTEIVTEIKFSPVLLNGNNSNSNGFSVNASSIYQNYAPYGPWCAFDNDPDTWWHSAHPLYEDGSGEYFGDNGVTFIPATNNSSVTTIYEKGEFIELRVPTPTKLFRYELKGRDGLASRDPGAWFLLGNTDGNWYEIDRRSNVTLPEKMVTSFTVPKNTTNTTKSFTAFLLLVTIVGGPNTKNDRGSVQIATWNLYTRLNNTNSNSESNNAMQPASSSSASSSSFFSTFAQCKNYAIANGFNLFGFQNAQSDGNGTCMVGKDLTQAQMYGEAYQYNFSNRWASYTTGGHMATLNNFGVLQVKDENNTAIYSTTTDNPSILGNYLGCYIDGGNRMIPNQLTNQRMDYTSCMNAAKENGYNYFGLQSYQSGIGSECWAGNDKALAISLGKATNCSTLQSTTETGQTITVGGGWTNSVYSVRPEDGATFYLILQNDGDMCIYLGSGPSDAQELIWRSNTVGTQGDPNPSYTAAKSRFGRNYMVSGETLYINDFIGSEDGSMVLILTSNGDLQLNASKKVSACLRQKDSVYMGTSSNANSVYQFETPGILSNLGLLGFVDADSNLFPYTTKESKYSDQYKKSRNVTSEGNDLAGQSYTGGNLSQCYAQCNENPECGGFVFTTENGGGCYPKTAAILGAATQQDATANVYRRNKIPTSYPYGSMKETANIDTIEYENYEKSTDPVPTNYGIRNVISSTVQQQLSQLEDKLNQLSAKINSFTSKFSDTHHAITDQATTNLQALEDYLANTGKTKDEIELETKNLRSITNIERNFNLVTLQNNYRYMFWSLLAGGFFLTLLNFHTKETQ